MKIECDQEAKKAERKQARRKIVIFCVSRSKKVFFPSSMQVSKALCTYIVLLTDLKCLTNVHALHTPEISRFILLEEKQPLKYVIGNKENTRGNLQTANSLADKIVFKLPT